MKRAGFHTARVKSGHLMPFRECWLCPSHLTFLIGVSWAGGCPYRLDPTVQFGCYQDTRLLRRWTSGAVRLHLCPEIFVALAARHHIRTLVQQVDRPLVSREPIDRIEH